MSVIIQIQGHEAIPVRAIPLLTNWRFMSPDIVAHVLGGAGGSNVSLFGDLRAYQLAEGQLQPIAMDWWVQFPLKKLQALTAQIKATESIDAVGYEVWREQSLRVLPAGVFVWKADYQLLHDKNWNSQYSMNVCALQGWDCQDDVEDHISHKLTTDELADDSTLKRDIRESIEILKRWEAPDFSPFMSAEQQRLVMEGFDGLLTGATPARTASPLAHVPVVDPYSAERPSSAPRGTAKDGPALPKKRTNLLTPLIEKAQRGEPDPFNAAVIWPKLCEMVESKTRPFIGRTESGLQWIDGNDAPQFLSKNALGDRLRRMKKPR